MAKPGNKSDVINSLVRGLKVLEAVASKKGGATAKQVSFMPGLNLSTSYHLLNSLVEAVYIQKSRTDSRFPA